MEKAKVMVNMAWSIATINNVNIERMDLQAIHLGNINTYSLSVWYSDGKEIIIRSDCTLIEK